MKNIIEENSQIPEMYLTRHKHDSVSEDFAFDYSSNLLKNTLSPVLYKNEETEASLNKLNDMVVVMLDEILPVRNMFFWTHSKYYNKHGR